jgi:hypothetical protein
MPCSLSTKTQPDSRGLVPAIHELNEAVVQIIPLRICCEDAPHLPSSRPMLHVVFALDGRLNIGVRLHIDKPFQSVSLGETWHQPFTVFPGTPTYIGGHAGLERAVRPVGYYVDPATFHRKNVPSDPTANSEVVEGRDKPGHDGNAGGIRTTTTLRPTICRKCSKKS